MTSTGAFLVSVSTISVAEIGDRTQLLSLVLSARYRRPVPVIAGILCATLANHAAAGLIGNWFGDLLRPRTLQIAVGVSMIGMALWTLKPDTLHEGAVRASTASAFVATLTSFSSPRSATRPSLPPSRSPPPIRPAGSSLPARPSE